MRFIPPAYIGLILFFLILVLAFGNAQVFGDPDTAWHIASGELIRSLHAIPLFDNWSFTAAGEHWYNLSWLFDVLISLLFNYGGFTALYLLTILVFAGSITYMCKESLRRGASILSVLLLLLPTLLVVFNSTLARPHLCSIVLTIAFYQLLWNFRETRKTCHLIILPALMVLWVNLHGGFLLAFPIMALFFAEAVFLHEREKARNYAMIIALCFVATSINPYGLSVYYGAYKTLAATFNVSLVEWQPAEIGHNVSMTLMLLLALCVFSSFDKRIAPVDRTLAIMLLILSLSSVRHGAITVLLIMPYMALRITNLLNESPFAEHLRKIDNAIMLDMQKPDIRIMASVMAIVAVVSITLPYPRDSILKEPIGFPVKNFPVKEAAYIAEHYPNLRFFNHYNIGGYLDYLWHGKVKVFVDGRANSLYSEDLLNDYTEFVENYGFGGRAKTIASEYKLDGLIIPNNDKNAGLWRWNTDWNIAYVGDVATVYLRKDLPLPPNMTLKPSNLSSSKSYQGHHLRSPLPPVQKTDQ